MKSCLLLIALAGVLGVPNLFAEDAYSRAVKAQTILKAKTDAAGHAIKYPKRGIPELSGYLVEIPPGGETGWHMHPYPCMAYILSGTVEVEQRGGPVRKYTKGDSFAELVKTQHNGRNRGKQPVKILLFVAGVNGAGPSVKK
mgnify:CR=1 FL=1